MQNIQLSIPLTNNSEIDIDLLYNQIIYISRQKSILKLVLEYTRIDTKNLVGVFPKFDFNIFGFNNKSEKILIFKFNNNRKAELGSLIELIELMEDKKEIDCINNFRNDNYDYDSIKGVIIRKINR